MAMASGFPFPTIDAPFGIKLWPIFDELTTKYLGYRPSTFAFVPGQTPMSTWPEVVGAIVLYYFIIFSGRAFMESRPALKLNFWFQLHNIFLTALSGFLWALLFEQIFPIIVRHGVFYSICSPGAWTQPLVFIYYLNYITKYIELIDTMFLFLKKKPLAFLHTYHHGATAALCWTQLLGKTSVSYVPIILNLTVHVVMYFYYFLSARGIRVWWKEWVTRIQIIQFVVDLGFIYFASYTHFAIKYFPWAPTAGDCTGEEFAALMGVGIISSYLVLFISFYLRVYSKSPKAARRAIKTGEIAIDPKFSEDVQASLSKGKSSGYESPVTRSRKA